MVRRVVLVATSFTMLLAITAASVGVWAYEKYNGQITRVQALQLHDIHIVKPTVQLHVQNYLIIGSDSRAGEGSGYGNETGARSDTTILVHLSKGYHRVTVISFPRDSWVHIPACKGSGGQTVAAHDEMFNSAFSTGGPSCTIKTVQELTGIAITHFVEVDFSGFKKIVDALGTVTMCSPVAVDDPNSKLVLKPGNNKLDGTQALAYVRARETLGDGSDLGRIKRQQMFLGTVLRKALSGSLLSDPLSLTDFLDAATRSITVDKATSLGDLRTLGTSMAGLNPKKVTFYTAPIANRDYSPPGTTYSGKVLLDTAKGRVLYDAVINDTVIKKTGGKHGSSAPKPDGTAGKATCSL